MVVSRRKGRAADDEVLSCTVAVSKEVLKLRGRVISVSTAYVSRGRRKKRVVWIMFIFLVCRFLISNF